MNTKNKKQNGFTLIELLVVIAIIGILSSVVVASLNIARAKGADTSVKSNLSGARSQAALIYDTQGCYGDNDGTTTCVDFSLGTCDTVLDNSIFNDTTIVGQLESARNAAGTGSLNACASIANGGNAGFAIAHQFKTDPLKGWCVDNNGTSKEVDLATADQAGIEGVIDGATANCL